MFDKLKELLDYYEKVKDKEYSDFTKEEREIGRTIDIDIARELVKNIECGTSIHIAKLMLAMWNVK